MRLRCEQRCRLILLYDKHRLHFAYKKFLKLSKLAKKENITISKNGCRNILEKWNLLESVIDHINENRSVAKTKISEHDLMRIDKAVYKDRDITAPKLKTKLGLQVSVRSVQRYVRVLGWRKIRSKTCQVVSLKNQAERLIFAKMFKETNEDFEYSIFSDETTVQLTSNAHKKWFKPFPDETRLGLIGKHKHLVSFHCIGAISRRGPSKLLVFDGNLDGAGFLEACDIFLVPFIIDRFPDFHNLYG